MNISGVNPASIETMLFLGRRNVSDIGFVVEESPRNVVRRAQAIRRAPLLGCSRRSFSICADNSPAMFFLASSKLLPLIATDGFLQRPFQPSSSDQKSQ
jgi:hypothetical protein